MSLLARSLGLALPLLVLLVATSPRAQGGPPALDEQTQAALSSLADELAALRRQLTAARASADSEAEASYRDKLQALRLEFAQLASRVDVEGLERQEEPQLRLEEELLELLAPLVEALKDATAAPRELAILRKRAAALRDRRAVAVAARTRTAATRDALPEASPARAEAQRELTERWVPLLDEIEREILVVEANLRLREDSQVPVWTRASAGAQRFLQNSGLNVLLCVTTFLVSYFGLRWLADRALRRKRERGFSIRLAEVVLRVLILTVAVSATMAVLYVRDDWLLLPIGIVFLIGAGWVVVKAAPIFFEQIRLILNVGPVREGERLLLDGLPYRVDSLQFYSLLVNPKLSGGSLRVPVKDLVGLRSRPVAHDEPWFPCEQGDVVALSDGVVGEVIQQTPEHVVVVEHNDAPRTYPIQTFLRLNPRNISRGFELQLTFGIGYEHLRDAVDEVPTALARHVEQGLAKDSTAAQAPRVRVELQAAGASSLDFAVLVRCGGEQALLYKDLQRAVVTLLVSACVERGYTIPVPQLEVRGLADQHRGDTAD